MGPAKLSARNPNRENKSASPTIRVLRLDGTIVPARITEMEAAKRLAGGSAEDAEPHRKTLRTIRMLTPEPRRGSIGSHVEHLPSGYRVHQHNRTYESVSR